MSHVMGDPPRVRTNFLILIEDLFGELEGIAADKTLRAGQR
jgi:hypothetical protein